MRTYAAYEMRGDPTHLRHSNGIESTQANTNMRMQPVGMALNQATQRNLPLHPPPGAGEFSLLGCIGVWLRSLQLLCTVGCSVCSSLGLKFSTTQSYTALVVSA